MLMHVQRIFFVELESEKQSERERERNERAGHKKFRAKYVYQIRLRYLITRLTIKSLGISMRMMRAHSLYIFMAPSMPEWKDLRVLVAFASFFSQHSTWKNIIISFSVGITWRISHSPFPPPPSPSRCAAISPSKSEQRMRTIFRRRRFDYAYNINDTSASIDAL